MTIYGSFRNGVVDVKSILITTLNFICGLQEKVSLPSLCEVQMGHSLAFKRLEGRIRNIIPVNVGREVNNCLNVHSQFGH
jgi:hypothetical protein